MLVQLLALIASIVLNAPAPERLNDPTRPVAERIPEGRVLMAETVRNGAQVPRRVQETLGPATSGAAFVVLDLESGSILATKEPSAIRPVASLTKLLTAFTVTHSGIDLDDVATVSDHAVRVGRRGADIGLVRGERIRVRDLLAGLLVPSGNDAAIALAEHVSGSEEAFARRMGETARTLGLSRTRAQNARGFDADTNFSSVYDVALLLAAAWRDPMLGTLLRTEELVISSVDGRRVHRLRTTNRLLGVRPEILGGKTGLTDAAGQNLAVVAESPGGHPVVAAVLGSSDRFGDMENILNWTFWAHEWPS